MLLQFFAASLVPYRQRLRRAQRPGREISGGSCTKISLTAAAPLQEEDRGEAGTSGHSSHVQADSEEVP